MVEHLLKVNGPEKDHCNENNHRDNSCFVIDCSKIESQNMTSSTNTG